jgi:hypothetical protein
MKRLFLSILVLMTAVLHASAQTPLEAFSAQANALLQAEFGFGITNIPIYSATNPAVGYSAAIHFQLQSAADLYDAGTPATNLPSVFRPLCSWQSNNLFIVGYSCVTTDFETQIGQGFKNITDPTITTNDNVWGIPWVVGTKGQIPAFNEYCYSSAINVQRQLAFVRRAGTSIIQYTNQLYMFSISNIFGAEAWNFYAADFTNSVTLMVSNVISINFTNNYNFGTNIIYDVETNSVVDDWPGGGFEIPLFFNTLPLPLCYWSELNRQLVPLTNGFLSSDLQQTHWPVHDWTVNITNNLMYALIDNNSGCVLDFVNLGSFGSSLDLNQVLTNDSPFSPHGVWDIAPATDVPSSPMSAGDLAEIAYGASLNPKFAASVFGLGPPIGYPLPETIFYVPGASPTNPGQLVAPAGGWASYIQSCSWHASCPLVHYTLADLADPTPRFNQEVEPVSLVQLVTQPLADSMSGQVCTLGSINPDYTSGEISRILADLGNGSFQMNFYGTPNLPYLIWSATNLVDWTPVGVASQPNAGSFYFSDLRSAGPMKFYDVRLP